MQIRKMNFIAVLVLTAGAGIAIGMAFDAAPGYGMEPRMMGGYGSGYGPTGPGSMGVYGSGYGPGAMAGRGMGAYGSDYGSGGTMGPGMMGDYGTGFGYGGMMGPGMMGGYGTGFGYGGMMGPGMMGSYGPGFGPGGMMGGYGPAYGTVAVPAIERLGLTADQQQAIRNIQQQVREQQQTLREQLSKQYAELRQLYSSGSADPQQLQQQQQKIFDLRRQMMANRAQAHDRIIGALTDEQKDKLLKYSPAGNSNE